MDSGRLPGAAEKIWEKLKKNRYALLVILIGLLLILWPGGSKGRSSTPAQESDPAPDFSLEAEQQRISDALSEIAGAGRVRVVLTLRAGAEAVVAHDTDNSSREDTGQTESRVTTVIVSAGSSKQTPVILKYLYPDYAGALVVAEGADSAAVRLQLAEAVAGLTGLPVSRVTVAKMAGG